MIGHLLVVDNDDDRARVAKLPHVGVLVDLFPGETAIPREEDVRVGVRRKLLADVAYRKHQPNGRRTAVCRLGISSLGVSVDLHRARDRSAIVLLAKRVLGGGIDRLPSSSIIMRDPRLNLLFPRDLRFARVRNDVDQSDTVQPNHFFKIDVSRRVSVDVLDREAVVCAVRVGLEDAAPFLVRLGVHRDVQEDRIG